MSYSRPDPVAAALSWQGTAAYVRPPANAVDVAFSAGTPSANAAAMLDLDPAAAAAHGVRVAAAAELELLAEASGTYTSGTVVVTAAAALDLVAQAEADHGVAGAVAAGVELDAAAGAAHGIGGTAAADLELTATAAAAHGIAGTTAAVLTLDAATIAVHQRYEVRGEVRQAGVLVNRRVRVYLRDTGALAGEADTVAGKFSVHTGFAAAEHYVVPVHLDEAATDWKPPVANRVVSVLAQDA